MILLCEHPAPCGMRERPINFAVELAPTRATRGLLSMRTISGYATFVRSIEAGSRRAYQDFLALWKDADPDIPVLQPAQAEYQKLRSWGPARGLGAPPRSA